MVHSSTLRAQGPRKADPPPHVIAHGPQQRTLQVKATGSASGPERRHAAGHGHNKVGPYTRASGQWHCRVGPITPEGVEGLRGAPTQGAPMPEGAPLADWINPRVAESRPRNAHLWRP